MPSNQPLAREGFERALSVPDADIDLALASLWIAAEEYPGLDVVQYLGRIALLGERAKPKVRRARTPYDGIYALNEVLFDEEGLRGNKNEYYDPRNSYISDVLERKLGIPIAICVIYMEVARRAGLRLRGIGIPGHFILRAGEGQAEIYVDCFDRGGLLTKRECATITRNSLGAGVDVEGHLAPYTNRAILRRALTNLKAIYLKQSDLPKALAAAERIKVVEPNLWDNLADLAKIHAKMGRFQAAAEMLAEYVERAPESNDLASARETLRQLRQLARGPGTTAD